ncbi:unnamed protein product [Lymnaea stagnalis]|uniref:Fe2OG dioxygenase domain-containing protein n=1 Tax=Lymnaea stagnalis TaxID=6523 RepID=A0AAV2H1T1_LYMST
MLYMEENKDDDRVLDLFTPEFKRLKARNPPPDLSEVLDLSSPKPNELFCPYLAIESDLTPINGLKPSREWNVYQFPRFPGFFVVQNPFLDGYDRYWVSRCLKDFPSNKDNLTNLSALGEKRGQNLWDDFVKKQSSMLSKGDPLRQLRWTTLGYHYNWTTKDYSDDNQGDFPQDVNCLSQYLAASLGLGPYHAEAAIVNYYHLDSTLAGHTDHSELDLSAPLFSISFGQKAIFLLGGTTKAVKPMAVYVRSGDVCVMSGDSRLAYHAVPKILSTPTFPKISTSSHSQKNSVRGDVGSKVIENVNQSAADENADDDPLKEKSAPAKRQADLNSSLDASESCACKLQKLIDTSCEHFSHMTPMGHSIQQGLDLVVMNCDNHKLLTQNCSDHSYKEYQSNIDQVNAGIVSVLSNLDFNYFSLYLKSSRINLNVRQVLPPGIKRLKDFSRQNKSL